MNKDQRALAYVNMYAILGALPTLISLVPEAKELVKTDKITLGFRVKNGPAASLVFSDGECRLKEGTEGANLLLPFASPEKFNGMIDGTVTPIPSLPGLLRVGFLLKKFVPLTDLLTRYLRASEEDLKNPDFFRASTTLMLGVIGRAVAALGNEDPVSRASASYIKDGKIHIGITGEVAVSLTAKSAHLSVDETAAPPEECFSYMLFPDLTTARDLFDGRINAVAAVGLGQIRIGGMISQVDNVNRILDRVAYYLA